jgi:hypothetical protein
MHAKTVSVRKTSKYVSSRNATKDASVKNASTDVSATTKKDVATAIVVSVRNAW